MGNMVWAKLSAAPDEAEAGVKEVEKVSKKLAECKTPGAEKVSEKLTGGTHKVVEATGKDHRRPNAMLEKQSSEEDASAKADV